jgi:hypothetical protein
MTNDDSLESLAARLDPVPEDAFRDFAGSPQGRAVLEAILSDDAARHRTLQRRPWRAGAALAVAAAIAAGVVAVRTAEPPARGPETRWAAAVVQVAEEAPRLLVGAPGWDVVDAIEFGGRQGEMTFDNGRSCMDAEAAPGCYWVSLNWYPKESYEQYLADRRHGAERSWDAEIAGHDAAVFRAPPATFYALWVDGDHWLELRSDVIPTVDEFVAVAQTLHAVDVDAWLSAMPDGVVEPDERPDAVDELLADVPVPSNLDVGALKDSALVGDGLEYEVATAVVCAWIEQWVDARRSGDDPARREAVQALASARSWKVLRDGGQGAEYVFDVADAMADGVPVVESPALPTGVGYQRHVGCDEG